MERDRRKKRPSAAVRARRRKRRRRAVLVQRLLVALFGVIILVGGSAVVWNMLPGIRVASKLSAADEYVETKDYDEAIASCKEALKIDSMSVEAYKSMAGAYLSKEDQEAAEQVLYQGWETTQDESLLQEYFVYLLNDAVSDINEGNCSFDTWGKCILAVETQPDNPDGYKLLDACFGRLFMGGGAELFCDGPDGAGCVFDRYLEMMDRMIQVYEETQKEEMKAEILKFAQPDVDSLSMEVCHLPQYREMLSRVSGIGSGEELQQILACAEKAAWAQDVFAGAFGIFESGEFEPIKDFMQSEDYLSIRDQFMAGTMEYWKGKTYIPVSRERMWFLREEGSWKFCFADFEENPETSGVIQIWSGKQEDAGVQRVCISYEPASGNGEFYPHTTYEFVYLYSNVKIGGEYVPQMNYRFDTKVTTSEGITTNAIGDWGGEHEWEIDY